MPIPPGVDGDGMGDSVGLGGPAGVCTASIAMRVRFASPPASEVASRFEADVLEVDIGTSSVEEAALMARRMQMNGNSAL